MNKIYVVGTADTKAEELNFLAGAIKAAGGSPLRVNVGTTAHAAEAEISPEDVARHHPSGSDTVLGLTDRGTAVSAMGLAFEHFMTGRDDVAGIVGIGGGGGTAIATAGMRALPMGIPKLMVSTLASGDVSPYVGVADITMMPSITDLAGLNRISRAVLQKAALAIVAMSAASDQPADSRPAIGLTMFGVTTTCVTAITDRLHDDYDCLVFHATGTGGRTMEKLADSHMLSGVLDITTTEICDLLFGGVLAAGEDRLDAIARTRLPYVGSVGALDMVNFWAPETIPEHYKDRLFYKHNSNVTLMRTTAAECSEIGAWIARKLNACEGPVIFLIPEKGVSALDIEGGAFFDPEADNALFSAIETGLNKTATRRIERLPLHINDPEFADAAAAAFRSIAKE